MNELEVSGAVDLAGRCIEDAVREQRQPGGRSIYDAWSGEMAHAESGRLALDTWRGWTQQRPNLSAGGANVRGMGRSWQDRLTHRKRIRWRAEAGRSGERDRGIAGSAGPFRYCPG